MNRLDLAVLTIYYGLLFLLGVYALHRFHLVRLRRRLGSVRRKAPASPGEWPAVVVQLPLFNEPNVVARLIEAAAALEYTGPLEIQVLDDSNDRTSDVAAACIASARARGVCMTHIRRATRTGFKAGALAEGMARTAGGFFAIFDADFVPPPTILQSMIPHFSDPAVGMVQARWGHLNRSESALTCTQALYLDAHFSIESSARELAGRFFNFNGTAGIWRREAIEQAGGWSSSTLTEDLDLSYRAQLAGWRFAFLPDMEVPAELPATRSAFENQQHRWAKGSIQTARKLLGTILRARLPLATRLEALLHLTNNCSYLLTLMLALMIVPSLVTRARLGLIWLLPLDAVALFGFALSLLFFCAEGQRLVGQRTPRLGELLRVIPLGIGLTVKNSAAVLEGLVQRGGEFRRTPKAGSAGCCIPEGVPRLPLAEAILTAFFASACLVFAVAGLYGAIPFLLFFLSGYGQVAGEGIRALLRCRGARSVLDSSSVFKPLILNELAE